MATPSANPPSLVWSLTEGSRSMSELAWFLAARGWLSRGRRGDGRPVLVLPGLMADDGSTAPLRQLLRSVGYRTYGWGLGVDIGPTARIVDGLDARLAYVRERNGGRQVSVIGQSLGGLMGRELARRNPGAVDRLISLGSPVTLTDRGRSRAARTYDYFTPRHLPEYSFDWWSQAEQPQIPSTSIYSRMDGVVAARACLYPDGPLTENIRVHGSHLGMGVFPPAVYAMLDRLAAPVGQWRRFAPPAHLRGHFPAVDHLPPVTATR